MIPRKPQRKRKGSLERDLTDYLPPFPCCPLRPEKTLGWVGRGERGFTSWGCPQGADYGCIPEVALAPRTAFQSTAWVPTRLPKTGRPAGWCAGTRAHVSRPGWVGPPMPRRLSHQARSSSNPSTARRPHTHRLRRARWEPLAEAKRTAVYPRSLCSDAGCCKEQTRPPCALPELCIPPACSILTCHSILDKTRAHCSLSQGWDRCEELEKHLTRTENQNKTRAKPRCKSAWTEDPVPDAVPSRYPEVCRKDTPFCRPVLNHLHRLVWLVFHLPAGSHSHGLCSCVTTAQGVPCNLP